MGGLNNANLGPPTLAGFQAFLVNVCGISTDILPSDSPVIPMALAIAEDLVALELQRNSQDMYTLAVYNLGASNVINYAQDQPDAPNVIGSVPPAPFFRNIRKVWNINGFVSGVVQSTSDETDSVSLVVQEAAKTFTLSNLQNLKDPYGRQYLSIVQRLGTIWGLS